MLRTNISEDFRMGYRSPMLYIFYSSLNGGDLFC